MPIHRGEGQRDLDERPIQHPLIRMRQMPQERGSKLKHLRDEWEEHGVRTVFCEAYIIECWAGSEIVPLILLLAYYYEQFRCNAVNSAMQRYHLQLHAISFHQTIFSFFVHIFNICIQILVIVFEIFKIHMSFKRLIAPSTNRLH